MEILQELHEAVRPFWVVWLMAVFLAIVAWAWWPKRKGEMERHGRIPLDDEEEKS
jgi:cytochrome c oxidase cbb3-type subunit 4